MYTYVCIYAYICEYVSAQEWRNRTVAKHACSKIGRAAARRKAPKQPRAIRAGPNEGTKKLGPQYRGIIRFFQHTGGLSDFFDLLEDFLPKKINPGIETTNPINPWYWDHIFLVVNPRNVDLP